MLRQIARQTVASRVLLSVGLLILASSSSNALAQEQTRASQCRPDGALVRVPELPEASGLALSRRVPGRLWTHNDSGEPTLFALDARGGVTARVRVTGARVDDWEAMAVGPCPSGSCVFIADIGDNAARRRGVTIYRIPEPAPGDTSTAAAEVINATYPDGAHDAEAVLVTAEGGVYIVTKGNTGPVSVYRVPANASPGASTRLERVGAPLQGRAAPERRITDAAVSPDGQWVALRSHTSAVFYRAADFVKGEWREAYRVDLTALGEPQGEGIALGENGAVYLAGEGGGGRRAGTLAQFSCEVPR